MYLSSQTLADVTFGDAHLHTSIRDGVARIEGLISSELSSSDELIRDGAPQEKHAAGFRFRPLFTMLAAQVGPNPDAWEVTVAGAAIEFIHLTNLCHENIIDYAGTRRDTPDGNTHMINCIAILAGDYRLAVASKLTSQLGCDAYRQIAETFAELVTGRMRETRGAAGQADHIEHYLRVARAKTGALIAASGKFGAAFAGATEQQILCLSRIGRLIGKTVQISDDIIAVSCTFDHSRNAGESDLYRQLRTLPMVYALREQGPDAHRLRALLSGPLDDDGVAQAMVMLRSSSGVAKARTLAASYAASARQELTHLPECASRQALATLIDWTIKRHT